MYNPLTLLEEAAAIATHHDAITGTSRQHVADDYAKRIAVGRAGVATFLSDAIVQLTGAAAVLPAGTAFAVCDLANATICPPLEASTAGGPVLLGGCRCGGSGDVGGNKRWGGGVRALGLVS